MKGQSIWLYLHKESKEEKPLYCLERDACGNLQGQRVEIHRGEGCSVSEGGWWEHRHLFLCYSGKYTLLLRHLTLHNIFLNKNHATLKKKKKKEQQGKGSSVSISAGE